MGGRGEKGVGGNSNRAVFSQITTPWGVGVQYLFFHHSTPYKKNTLILGVVLSGLATSCSEKKSSPETTTTTSPAAATGSPAVTPDGIPGPGAGAATYTCSMHPEVTANEPGKCSKCGMDLVKK